MTSLTVLFVTLLLILMFSISRIKVHLEYHRNQQDDRFFVNVVLIKGLIEFKKEFTSVDLEKRLMGMAVKLDSKVEAEVGGAEADINSDKSLPLNYRNIKKGYNTLKKIHYHLRFYKNVLIKLIKLTNVRELDWRTRFGIGDAAETGIAAGLVWSLKSNVVKLIYRWAQGSVNNARVNVCPDFMGHTLNIDLRCIFDIKTGHIIIAGCKILIIRFKLLFLRTVKGV